jgi:hypothetical protein
MCRPLCETASLFAIAAGLTVTDPLFVFLFIMVLFMTGVAFGIRALRRSQTRQHGEKVTDFTL